MSLNTKSTQMTRFLSVFLVLVVAVMICQYIKDVVTLFDDHKIRGYSINECIPKICSVEYNNLAKSFLWSHRGHYEYFNSSRAGNDCTDATLEAMSALLSSGISNFDVDVINVAESEPTMDKLVVAHPTLWKRCHRNNTQGKVSLGHFHSVESFLNLIKSHFSTSEKFSSSENVFPTVSIEPKFQNRNLLSRLIRITYDSISAPIQRYHEGMGYMLLRVAIVVHNVDTLHFVSSELRRFQRGAAERMNKSELQHLETSGKHHLPLLTVALSYRSQLLKPDDYVWTSLSTDRVWRQKHGVEENLFYIKKFHMPDVALLLSHSSYSMDKSVANQVTSNDVHARMRFRSEIVAWVVDEPMQLCAALGKGADAVISNAPILLLNFLKNVHKKHCDSK